MRKAIATIKGEAGRMTIYYNGRGKEMTAECGELVEEIGYTADNIRDAINAAYAFYNWGDWEFEPDESDELAAMYDNSIAYE